METTRWATGNAENINIIDITNYDYQQLAVNSLSLASQTSQSILKLF